MQKSNQATAQSFPQPLDRLAIVVMLILSVLIGGLLWSGDRSAPRVRDFSWQDKHIGADDTAFTLTFSRPMDHDSVEKNLHLDPPLPGKTSWAGRRMAYTLTVPPPYGTSFKVKLENAQDRFSEEGSGRAKIQPFTGQFQTRDRAFAYIGVEGGQEGRLILYNLTRQQDPILLTPPNLTVLEFKPYPGGDRILFAAAPRSNQPQDLLNQQLYTVTTGINVQKPIDPGDTVQGGSTSTASKSSTDAGLVELVLDSKDYQNLKFDLSTDGQTIVVQRVNRAKPGEAGLWILRPNAPPQPLNNQPGGDFLITPDSSSLALTQGQGLALLPLQPGAKPLDFLPKFGMVLSFAKDGSAAAMVKFNTDYTRSLFLVTNQGRQQELFKTTGSILSAQFDPMKTTLYCLLTNLLPGETYQEEPYLAAIDLKTSKLTPLLRMPGQRDVQVSLAPDGLGILLDQTVAVAEAQAKQGALRNSEGKAIATSRLWLLPLLTDPNTNDPQPQPEPLPLSGFRPRWLP